MTRLRARQTPGVPDHAAPSNPSTGWRGWVSGARKAIAAFVASGALVWLGPAITHFDWSKVTLAGLWDGLGSGIVVSAVVYFMRNESKKLGISVEMEALIEQMVEDKLHAKLLRVQTDRIERRPL